MAVASAGCLTCGPNWRRESGVTQVIPLRRLTLSGQPRQNHGSVRALHSALHSVVGFSGSHDIPSISASPPRVASVLRPVMQREQDKEDGLPTSALAIAAAAAFVSEIPFGFLTKIGDPRRHMSSPSAEFLALCSEQLSLCEKILGHQTNLTVYVRTAESYPTSELEFFLAAGHPSNSGWNSDAYKEVLMLIDKSESQGSIVLVESALVQHEAIELPEVSSLVLPLVKDMFLVGLLVAEQCVGKGSLQAKKQAKLRAVRPSWPPRVGTHDAKEASIAKVEDSKAQHPALGPFTKEQQAETAKIARTLALACVMDQRSVLLQQYSWQRGVRIDNLVEQVRGPLMAVRTLSKILLPHLKRGEISRDVVEDILVQGDRMNDVVQQMQKNAVNPSHNDEDIISGLKAPTAMSKGDLPLDELRQLRPLEGKPSGYEFISAPQESSSKQVLGRDEESPMPPLALVALPHEETRLCNVSEVLHLLVRGGSSLAEQKNQLLQLKTGSKGRSLMAAIDEFSLREALSNILEYSMQHTPAGGWISAEVVSAPGGGVLVVIEDNGPDMGLLVQQRILGPLGSAMGGSTKGNRQNERSFDAGLSLIAAREVLEQSSAILNIRSPYLLDAPIGSGGTHIEIWLPVTPADVHIQTGV